MMPRQFYNDDTQDLFIPPHDKILPEVHQERDIPFWVISVLIVLVIWACALVVVYIVVVLVSFKGVF